MPTFVLPDEDVLTVFTDGAMLPGPRRGGIGIHFVHTDHLGNEETFDLDEAGYAGATGNRMELLAVITALKAIQGGRIPAEFLEDIKRVDIYSDSQYVVENLNNAIYTWPNNWTTKDGPPVLNVDLWKDLVREYKRLRREIRVELKWRKGHSADNPHNKVADKLAKKSATRALRRVRTPAVRRKTTRKLTESGSVEMLGQRLTIRIIEAAFVGPGQPYRYRYEVVSRSSPFYGNVDFAYSDDPLLQPGHGYFVTMGKDQSYPTIAKRHREAGKKPADDQTDRALP